MNSQKKIGLNIAALAVFATFLISLSILHFLSPGAGPSIATAPINSASNSAQHPQATPYNFFVYGSPAAVSDMKASITRWGGRLQDQLTIETDFVVVDARPADEALAKKYDQVLNESKELGIPIMDRNRLLYFVGQNTGRPTTGG